MLGECEGLGVTLLEIMPVILDVVYHHLGPDGNYLKEFAPHYFRESHQTDWGEALNFDDPLSGPVRDGSHALSATVFVFHETQGVAVICQPFRLLIRPVCKHALV